MIIEFLIAFNFVISIYIWKLIKRTLRLEKNHKLKTLSVAISVLISYLIVFYQSEHCNQILDCLQLNISLQSLLFPICLNSLLFAGSILQQLIDGDIQFQIKELNFQTMIHTKAPILEEIAFRVLIYQVDGGEERYLLKSTLLFSLAHAHIGYRLYRKTNSLKIAFLRTGFILSYTGIFGLYSSYVFKQTKSLLSVMILHGYCNFLQFPKFGKIFKRESKYESYLILLIYIIGIMTFFYFI